MAAPILRLRAAGYLSSVSCSMTDEERELYDAARAFQNLPVIWYRKVRTKAHPKVDPTLNNNVIVMKRQKSMVHEMMDDVKDLLELSSPKGTGDETYVGINAVLSLCDTDSGPALEIQSTAVAASSVLNVYDIVDISEDGDVLTSFIGENNTEEKVIERTIHLSDIDHAAQGGKWQISNMMNVRSGTLSCGIKVYGVAAEDQVFGTGSKVLLFDVPTTSSLKTDQIISHINALVQWNKANQEHKSRTEQSSEEDASGSSAFNDLFCC